MDPRSVLGVSVDADEEAIAVAYRKLAKRFHPDTQPGNEDAAAQMAEINVAYALLRDAMGEVHARHAPAPAVVDPQPFRELLGRELAAMIEPGESVVVVTDAATWDSFRVRLAVTDRRLLWLRDDAPTDRVRSLRWREVATLDGRLRGPRRRVGELRVQPRSRRRLSFSELEPAALRLVLTAARRHVPAS
jgi:DnaJ domain